MVGPRRPRLRPGVHAASATRDPFERLERPVDFLGGVVVDEPESEYAADLGPAETLDKPCRIEVAVPGVDALTPQRLRGRAWRDAVDGDRDRRNALRRPR